MSVARFKMKAEQYEIIAERLRALVLESLDEQPAAWLGAQLAGLENGVEPTRLMAAHAGIARRVRGSSLRSEERLFGDAAAAGLPGLAAWDAARAARVVLVHAALDATECGDHVEIVGELYRTGDNAEREALLGALLLLPRPERFVAVAVDACRSNVEGVFAAIACENAYPARHFSDASFNQMVLKTVFIGLPLVQVVGLHERSSAELVRMARDFASERRAAGRPVPEDLDLIFSTHAGGAVCGDT